MIALIASALLGLYVFVPYIVFHRLSSLFIRLNKSQRTKTEEVVAGIIVAGLPFVATSFLFWIGAIGGCFPGQKTSDNHIVFDAVYSDHYFTDHEPAVWDALNRVYKRQADFLFWNYIFLLLEAAAFILLTRYYSRLRRYRIYAWFASHVLLPGSF